MTPVEYIRTNASSSQAWIEAAHTAYAWAASHRAAGLWPDVDRLLCLEAFFRLMAIVRSP